MTYPLAAMNLASIGHAFAARQPPPLLAAEVKMEQVLICSLKSEHLVQSPK